MGVQAWLLDHRQRLMRKTGSIGEQWLPRCSVLIIPGLVINLLLLAGFLVLQSFDLPGLPSSYGAEWGESSPARAAESDRPDLSTLNVRLSTRPIHPPEQMVKRTVLLQGVRGARPFVGEPTRAAILEDDARRRLVVLSDTQGSGEGPITAYLLHEFDLERHLPHLTACTWQRQCARDRTPGTGGLGCIAMCLVQALRE